MYLLNLFSSACNPDTNDYSAVNVPFYLFSSACNPDTNDYSIVNPNASMYHYMLVFDEDNQECSFRKCGLDKSPASKENQCDCIESMFSSDHKIMNVNACPKVCIQR